MMRAFAVATLVISSLTGVYGGLRHTNSSAAPAVASKAAPAVASKAAPAVASKATSHIQAQAKTHIEPTISAHKFEPATATSHKNDQSMTSDWGRAADPRRPTHLHRTTACIKH